MRSSYFFHKIINTRNILAENHLDIWAKSISTSSKNQAKKHLGLYWEESKPSLTPKPE